MNRQALQKLSYGVYLVTTANQGKLFGCVANSAMQITSSPARIAVSISHDNATFEQMIQSRRFALSVLSTEVAPTLIGGFGYRSSRNSNKFQDVAYSFQDGLPVPDSAMAWITCNIIKTMDAGTHTIFLGEVADAEVTREAATPMTYDYYHKVIKGRSPKNAPTYVGE